MPRQPYQSANYTATPDDTFFVPLTSNSLYTNALAEHIQSNAEALERVMVEYAPATQLRLSNIHAEWLKINGEINQELKEALEAIHTNQNTLSKIRKGT